MQQESSSSPALRWTLIALTLTTLVIGWPFWTPLVLASWTATMARPLLLRFERGFSGRTNAAATLALLLFVLLALPIAFFLLGILSGGQELYALVTKAPSAREALVSLTAGDGVGDAAGPTHFPSTPAEFVQLVRQYGEQGYAVLSSVAGAAATGLIAVFLYFGGAFVFLVDGPEAWAWMKRHSPLSANHLQRFGAAFHETGRGLLIGVGLTSLAQGLVATLVYLLLGVPRWWVLGPMTGVASMLPVVGSALVWGPVALGFAFTDHLVKATVLVLLGIGVIGSVDNVMRPLFTRFGDLKMPTFVLFVSIFGGLAVFGTWGALLGPLVVRLWMEALTLRREEQEALAASPSTTPPPAATGT